VAWRLGSSAVLFGAASWSLAVLGGCALVGGMAQSAYLTGSTEVPAAYTGLEGKTWAVVTLVPRGVRSEIPNIEAVVTNATTRKLVDAQTEGVLRSAGFQPGTSSLLLSRTQPSFSAWTYSEMAEELGVERLIVIDINLVRLYERGNALLWDGAIAARVGVVEADMGGSDFAFQRDFTIRYPDGSGYTTEELSEGHIVNTLLDRLTDRAAWLFFEHEEPNVIEY